MKKTWTLKKGLYKFLILMDYYRRKSEWAVFWLTFVTIFLLGCNCLLLFFMFTFGPSPAELVSMIIMELIVLTVFVYFFILTILGDSIVISEMGWVKNFVNETKNIQTTDRKLA